MRTLNVLAFDEVIVGTGKTWYTPQNLNAELGQCDIFALHAFTTGVAPTSTLTVAFEHSGDGQHWTPLSAAAELNAVSISSDASSYGFMPGTAGHPARFVRAAIALGGTSPQCRLKLFITGRTFAT